MQHQNDKKINFVQTAVILSLFSCEIHKNNMFLLDTSPFESQSNPKIESSEQLCSELRLLTSPVLLHRACQIIHKIQSKKEMRGVRGAFRTNREISHSAECDQGLRPWNPMTHRNFALCITFAYAKCVNNQRLLRGRFRALPLLGTAK